MVSEVGKPRAGYGGCGLTMERIGLEAVAIAYSLLADAGMPVLCVETRHRKRRCCQRSSTRAPAMIPAALIIRCGSVLPAGACQDAG